MATPKGSSLKKLASAQQGIAVWANIKWNSCTKKFVNLKDFHLSGLTSLKLQNHGIFLGGWLFCFWKKFSIGLH